MKNKVVMFNLVALLFASATFAQGVENDDMYFNSKDRAKLRAQQATEKAAYSASVEKRAKNNKPAEQEYYLNPTDSYSARNVNPEFAARSNSQMAQVDNQDYFVSDYRYNTVNSINSWNNNFNSWYTNPWYNTNYFGPSINNWNSPYYGSAFDGWGNPWNNPYYRSGWGSSFSYHWGSSWNYGWGNGMGWGMNAGWGNPYMMNGWGNPYMNSWSSFGYGGAWGWNRWNNNFYPRTVVIVNNGGEGAGRGIEYGKRATRTSAVTTPQRGAVNNTRTRSTYVAPTTGGRPSDAGGRVATENRNQRQADYYNRSWRTNSQQGQRTSPSRNSSNDWGNTNRSSDSNNSYNSNSRNSGSYNQPTRSYSPPSSGTRSSAPASSGSSGRTRGRD